MPSTTPMSEIHVHWTLRDGKSRSCHKRCSVKKDVLKNFTKLTGKHLCQSLFFNKVAGLRHTILLKKGLAQMSFCEFCERLKNIFFYRTPLDNCFYKSQALIYFQKL